MTLLGFLWLLGILPAWAVLVRLIVREEHPTDLPEYAMAGFLSLVAALFWWFLLLLAVLFLGLAEVARRADPRRDREDVSQ